MQAEAFIETVQLAETRCFHQHQRAGDRLHIGDVAPGVERDISRRTTNRLAYGTQRTRIASVAGSLQAAVGVEQARTQHIDTFDLTQRQQARQGIGGQLAIGIEQKHEATTGDGGSLIAGGTETAIIGIEQQAQPGVRWQLVELAFARGVVRQHQLQITLKRLAKNTVDGMPQQGTTVVADDNDRYPRDRSLARGEGLSHATPASRPAWPSRPPTSPARHPARWPERRLRRGTSAASAHRPSPSGSR